MDKWGQIFTNLKQGALAVYDDLESWFYRNQKRGLLTFLGVIAVVAAFSVSMVVAQARIRQSEYDEIIQPEVSQLGLSVLDYGKEDGFIKEQKAVSVMFAPPHGDERNLVDAILLAKKSELNRKIYYYPLVYNTYNVGKQYNIDPTKITFLFFENGEEKNRLEFSSLENPQGELLPELNRLPMWNIKTIDE